LMQLVQFVLAKQDSHYFVTEFDSFFLSSYDIEEFILLLLMFLC
jgi:hypothetical protein